MTDDAVALLLPILTQNLEAGSKYRVPHQWHWYLHQLDGRETDSDVGRLVLGFCWYPLMHGSISIASERDSRADAASRLRRMRACCVDVEAVLLFPGAVTTSVSNSLHIFSYRLVVLSIVVRSRHYYTIVWSEYTLYRNIIQLVAYAMLGTSRTE